MGKETKETLKAILSDLELIMKHLKITRPGNKPEKKEVGQEQKAKSQSKPGSKKITRPAKKA